jgi:hypothetical protein
MPLSRVSLSQASKSVALGKGEFAGPNNSRCQHTARPRATYHQHEATFIIAVKAVAEQVTGHGLAGDQIYPPRSQIAEASHHVAIYNADYIFDSDLACVPRPMDIAAHVKSCTYHAVYDEQVQCLTIDDADRFSGNETDRTSCRADLLSASASPGDRW